MFFNSSQYCYQYLHLRLICDGKKELHAINCSSFSHPASFERTSASLHSIRRSPSPPSVCCPFRALPHQSPKFCSSGARVHRGVWEILEFPRRRESEGGCEGGIVSSSLVPLPFFPSLHTLPGLSIYSFSLQLFQLFVYIYKQIMFHISSFTSSSSSRGRVYGGKAGKTGK